MTNDLRHYEIVLLVHPDQAEQIPSIVQRYRSLIENGGGKIHRLEDWGRRPLAYLIKKNSKANYLLMNIECNKEVLNELKHNFRFSDNILRNMILRRDEAITDPSPMMGGDKEKLKRVAISTDKAKIPGTESTSIAEEELIAAGAEDSGNTTTVTEATCSATEGTTASNETTD